MCRFNDIFFRYTMIRPYREKEKFKKKQIFWNTLYQDKMLPSVEASSKTFIWLKISGILKSSRPMHFKPCSLWKLAESSIKCVKWINFDIFTINTRHTSAKLKHDRSLVISILKVYDFLNYEWFYKIWHYFFCSLR